ncbi:hypothetical protein [Nosocomiicoccus sp. HMSC09A07]|uniref:tetratricopeptide repeat protein n=1 Tax=Nosocomiicoccus sp. HMSC09A07 TaxID=1581145 RepID=UPI0008A1FB31|nr:hypothetical protein [Nosocomiicoccus sp. HMSC09A07]OFS62860.1 hypothetical protein HMPREF3177_04585 [Nosocomiicoccus sp. HMSC09A07]
MKSKIISLRNDGRVYYRQAMKKKHHGSYRDALNLMERALNESKEREYMTEYAYILTLLGEYDRAEQFIMTEFAASNFDTTYYYELSEMNVLIEDANKGLLFGILYAELHKDDDYYDDLMEMFTVEDYSNDELLKEAKEFVGQYIFQSYFMSGQIETSLDYLDDIDFDLSNKREFRNLRGMALLFLNRFEEAEAILTELLKEDQTDMHALSHLTLLYFYTNRHDLYVKFLRHLEVVEPLDEDDRLKVGLVLNFLKKHKEAYQLLYPLYKKKYMVNFQLLHALSQAAYKIGEVEEAEMFWKEMQLYHPLDEIHSPWQKEQAAETLNKIIDEYLQSDDPHKRILGLFRTSIIRPEDVILGSPVWDLIEQFGNFEKMYTAYIFNNFKFQKFDILHEGLEVLSIDYLDRDDILLGWIDAITHIDISELKESGKTYALAFLYVYYNDGFTVETLSEKYQVYPHKLKKAIEDIKQNE